MTVDEYIERLKYHNWHYEFEDNFQKWKDGHDNLSRLIQCRDDLDPDREIWNRYAPNWEKING